MQFALSSEFLQYLAGSVNLDDETVQLPSLHEIGQQLGISVASLREQVEVAKALGLVEVRPRTGMRRMPFTFTPAVRQSLSYGISINKKYFEDFSSLRNHVEAAYWHEAVGLLTPSDHDELRALMASAWEKLHSPQIQIPHQEHRQLHMTIFKRLDNPFVLGILEAYWEAYEAVGLNLYAGYEYLQEVWQYHQKMVDAICAGDISGGYQALVEHSDLLYHRPIAMVAGNGSMPD